MIEDGPSPSSIADTALAVEIVRRDPLPDSSLLFLRSRPDEDQSPFVRAAGERPEQSIVPLLCVEAPHVHQVVGAGQRARR